MNELPRNYFRCLLYAGVFFGFIFFVTLAIAADSKKVIYKVAIPLVDGGGSVEEHLVDFPVHHVIHRVKVTSDLFISKSEFLYLTNFQNGASISVKKLSEAFFLLASKKIFSAINLALMRDGDQAVLYIQLKGIWTLKNVTLSGILSGKDRYLQHYQIMPGEVFDSRKHHSSLRLMKQAFQNEGYCAATVTANVVREHRVKKAAVAVAVDRGSLFTIAASKIVIQGEDEVSPAEEITNDVYRNILKPLHGSRYDKETLIHAAERVRKYICSLGYWNAHISVRGTYDKKTETVQLDWNVNLPVKVCFQFTGNKLFSSLFLTDYLLRFGKSVIYFSASVLAHEIELLYKKRGYLHARAVVTRTENLLDFLIEEGNAALISEIVIQGVSESTVTEIMQRFFKTIAPRKAYSDTALEAAIDSLIAYYLQDGYKDVSVVWNANIVEESNTDCVLVVSIDPGERWVIQESSIVTEEFKSNESVMDVLAGHIGVPCNQDFIEKQRHALHGVMKKRGFHRASITVECGCTSPGKAVLKWSIVPGETVRFGKTVVEGSVVFDPHLLLHECAYQEGDIWDDRKIKKTINNLKELSLFDVIALAPTVQCREDGICPVVFRLQQDSLYELRLRAGFELQNIWRFQRFDGIAYRCGGTLSVRNPFNGLDRFLAHCNFSRYHREVLGMYIAPYLGGYPLRGECQVYGSEYNQPNIEGGTKNIYRTSQQGALATLSSRHGKSVASISVGIERIKTVVPCNYAHDDIARAINFDYRLLDRFISYFVIEPVIFFDHLDNKLFPTEGSSFMASMKTMISLSAEHCTSLCKFLTEATHYIPLGPITLATRLRAGYILTKNLYRVMPSERFYLGGSRSLRGYDTDLAPPLGTFIDKDDKCRFVPQGGSATVNGNIEIRIPVMEPLELVFFQDLGFLYSSLSEPHNHSRILESTGVGFRVKTPVGPLRFDIGKRWTKDANSPSYAWTLTFGNVF